MPLTPTPDQQMQALVAAQAQLRAQYTAQAVALAAAAAAGFTGWYDTAQITEWATNLAKRIESYQRAVAQTTDAYLARALSMMTGSRFRPAGRVDVTDLRQGITHAGTYGRAADVYRWQQSQFDSFTRQLAAETEPQPYSLIDPIDAATERVKKAAAMDTQLAFRAQSRQVMADAHEQGIVTGYRRVIHPELSKGGTCGLCIAASDRLYRAKDLLPVHNQCECTTLPVLDHADPGSTLNQLDLKRLYRAAGGTGQQQLKATRYQIDEHGELGPVLNPRGAKVRTAADVARDGNKPPRTVKSTEEIAAEVTRIRTSLTQALPKAQTLADSDPKQWGDYLAALQTRIRQLDDQLAA